MLVREGLRRILQAQDDMDVVGEAGDSAAAVAAAARERPDVVLLDVEIPGGEAAATVRKLREASPQSRVIILSMHEGAVLVQELLAAGIRGYLLKSIHWQELVLAIRTVHLDPERVVLGVSGQSLRGASQGPGDGAMALSAREREILGLVGEALSNGQIASRLALKRRGQAAPAQRLRQARRRLPDRRGEQGDRAGPLPRAAARGVGKAITGGGEITGGTKSASATAPGRRTRCNPRCAGYRSR